jgi:DNA-binding winged helix-turn-helix (wHTH) protein
VIYAFSDCEVDIERQELRRRGSAVELQPKVLELLLYLIRNGERVVPKEELLAAVWPEAVVTDNSLARAVSLARRAIGDRGAEPSVIVNVPRRGYRFQAPIRTIAGEAGAASTAPRYVGRAGLLTRLEESLAAALSGHGRILLLAGEAGVGKTRTAELLVERARARGAEIAAAWGQEEGAPTYWAWTRALRALAAAAPRALATLPAGRRSDLASLVPEPGGGRGTGAPAPASGEASRFRVFEAVQAFLTRAAAQRPLALVLDDLHAADGESLWLLEFVGQSLGSLPIALLAACREEEAGRTPQRARAFERLLRLTTLERWPLAGLRGEEIRDFVRVELGREPDAGLVGALERQTGGNPLLLGESLRSLEARGLLGDARTASDWEALLPSGVGHLLQPKLRRLGAGALQLLGCAAAVGLEVERSLLARCLGEPADLGARLRELEEASLLLASAGGSRLRFSHALVREALYAELVPPGDGRRALHACVAAAFEEDDAASDDALAVRAHHACEAVPLVATGRAVALCEAAGKRAARLHDFERAAAWYQRALAVPDPYDTIDASTRTALLLGLGAAQTRASGLERARAHYRQAADAARSLGRFDLFVSAALGFAHRPITSGHADDDVIALLEEAAQCAPTAPEALRIRVLSRLAAELRYAEPARAEALTGEAIAGARRLGDPAVLAQTLDDCSFVRWSIADPKGWVALNEEITRAAHAANDLELALLGQKGCVTGFLELGDVGAVEREIRACEGTADLLRTPYARWLCAALRAMRALLAGDLEAAEREVADSVVLGERVDSRDVALELQAQLVYLRLQQGRGREIEAAARAQAQRFPDAAVWRAALARILVAAGQPAEARRELERLVRVGFTDVPRDRGWLPTLALAAEVVAAIRDESAAAALEALLTPCAGLGVVAGSGLLYYGPVSHHLGLLAAAASRWDAAIVHFEAALASEERTGAQLWQARSRLGCGGALLARGAASDRARVLRLASEAGAAASRHGWAEIATEARELERASWSRRGSPRPRRPGRRAHGPES